MKEDIFDYAYNLAKIGDKKGCKEFLKTYANWIMKTNKNNCNSLSEAYYSAKHNIIYFSKFYSNDIYNLIKKTYNNI